MKIYIRHMVSQRCKMVVQKELSKLNLHWIYITLGMVEINEIVNAQQYMLLKNALMHFGLELIDDRKSILIDKIKSAIIEMLDNGYDEPKFKNSAYLSAKLHLDYTYLANIFSETTGNTIEHYIITQKIEKVKELILYNELNLTKIAFKLYYSSVAHLSAQFKQITGITPSSFRHLCDYGQRIELENV